LNNILSHNYVVHRLFISYENGAMIDVQYTLNDPALCPKTEFLILILDPEVQILQTP